MSSSIENNIFRHYRESFEAIRLFANQLDRVHAISLLLSSCLERAGTVYLCGNGGSAADAQHVAAEFVGRFLRERRPLPAVALTCNTSILTALGNDYGFAEVFSRQVRAHVTSRDCVVGISTSGRSENVLEALKAARKLNARTVGFTGLDGQAMITLCDECLVAQSASTPRIQESHLLAWHLICEDVEYRLFSQMAS